MTRWLACAPEGAGDRVGEALRVLGADGGERCVADAREMRRLMLAEPPGEAAALVWAPVGGMEAVNLAAALARDGHAAEVVLVSEAASGSLRSRAERAGVSRVLTPDQLVEPPAAPPSGEVADIEEPDEVAAAVAALPAPRPSRPARGRGAVLCLVSGRGGVGKTCLSCLLAFVARRWGLSVAVCDLDLCSGNAFAWLGLPGGSDLARLAESRVLSDGDVLGAGVRVDEGLGLWGPCARPELAETLGWRVGRVVDVLARHHDLVVADASTTFTDAVAQAVQACDRLLVVARDGRGSVAPMARTASLAVRLGIERTRISRVMSFCDWRDAEDESLFRGASGLETARSFRMLASAADLSSPPGPGGLAELAGTDDDLVRSAASMLAAILSEMGRLPDAEEAGRALGDAERSPRRGLIRRLLEVR